MKFLNYKLILQQKNEEIEKIPLILKNKKIKSSSRKNKKIKQRLRKKISSNRIKKFDSTPDTTNLFFYTKPPLAEIKLKLNLSSFLRFYMKSNKTEPLYENYIKNPTHEQAYRFFYNKLMGKIQTYQLIDTDRGENFELSSNKFTKLANLFTHLFNFIPLPILSDCTGGVMQFGFKQASEKRKIKKTKTKLNHCITDTNFIKLLSILLTRIHERDFEHQEELELFIETIFQDFWALFKSQVKKNPNKLDLNQFWSEFLVEYFKALNCPLQKEVFYGIVNTAVKENLKKEEGKNTLLHLSELWQPADLNTPALIASIEYLFKNLETNLQKECFMNHCKALIQNNNEKNFISISPPLTHPASFWSIKSDRFDLQTTTQLSNFTNAAPLIASGA